MSDSPLLVVDDVVKSYGDTKALKGVSFTVDGAAPEDSAAPEDGEPGNIVGLLGRNGAGKSTLFRAVSDLTPMDAGSITVAGFDSRRESLEVRRRLGYLPEEARLDELLTGEEFLDLVAALKGLDDARHGRDIAERFGLGKRLGLLIGEYSLGMRKKIGLAAALMGSSPLILLDEPLNGLDTESMRRLRLLIEDMAAAGTCFLISSHVMAFVERICHRLVILHRGEIVADGSPDELRQTAGLSGEPFEDVFLHLTTELPSTTP